MIFILPVRPICLLFDTARAFLRVLHDNRNHIPDKLIHQLLDFRFKSRRKQGYPAPLRNEGTDFLHFIDKSHIQHQIRFIQNEPLYFIKLQAVPAHKIHNTSRSSHDDMGFLPQRLYLFVYRESAEYGGNLQPSFSSYMKNFIADLHG